MNPTILTGQGINGRGEARTEVTEFTEAEKAYHLNSIPEFETADSADFADLKSRADGCGHGIPMRRGRARRTIPNFGIWV